MYTNFRAHELAVELSKRAVIPRHLKDQLVRASSSVALNLFEGLMIMR